jgi:photosystem II stability/assembly factor-like uncharacterized protein
MMLPVRLLAVLSLLALNACATEPARFYAAVAMTKAQKNSSVPTDSGIYYREASGEWVHFGPRILGIGSISAEPGNPDHLLIASADGVVRSTDGGATWRKTTGWEVIDVRSIAFDRQNPARVYAATQWGPIRSIDGGASWQLAQQGLAKLYTQTVVADRTQSGRVLIGAEDGIYVSTDAAQTWTRVASSPNTTILRLAQSATDARRWIAGTQHHGVWLSRDGGATWTQTDPGSAKANLYAVALNPQAAPVMAVGGWDVGVRISTDGGATWSDRSAGLPTKHVFVLAFDPDVKGRLWASAFEEGTFYSDDLGLTWLDGGLYGAYGFDYVFVPAPRR